MNNPPSYNESFKEHAGPNFVFESGQIYTPVQSTLQELRTCPQSNDSNSVMNAYYEHHSQLQRTDTFRQWIAYMIENESSKSSEQTFDDTKLRSDALLAACVNGDIDRVSLLVDVGVNIEHTDVNGKSPLYIACEHGYEDIVTYLINKGANINTVDKMGVSALVVALRKNRKDVVVVLISNNVELPIMVKDEKVRLILIANKSGRHSLVKQLIEMGVSVDTKDKEGDTLLLTACRKGHLETVKVLLDKGAKLEARSPQSNRTPLLMATYCHFPEIIALLVEKGADVTARDTRGKVPAEVAGNVQIQRMVSLSRQKGIFPIARSFCDYDECRYQGAYCCMSCTYFTCLPFVCTSYLAFHGCQLPVDDNKSISKSIIFSENTDKMVYWACCGKHPWSLL